MKNRPVFVDADKATQLAADPVDRAVELEDPHRRLVRRVVDRPCHGVPPAESEIHRLMDGPRQERIDLALQDHVVIRRNDRDRVVGLPLRANPLGQLHQERLILLRECLIGRFVEDVQDGSFQQCAKLLQRRGLEAR